MSSSTPPNLQAELARERNRIAADRTLLSWIRTGITLIGVGFGVDQSVQSLYQRLGDVINPLRFSHLLGLALVGLGTFAVIMAAIDHQKELHRLAQPDYFYTPRLRLGEVVGIVLIAIALICIVVIGGRILFE